MTEREIYERIVAQGDCHGIDCCGDGCPLISGACGNGENVRRAKAWLESHKEGNMDKKQEVLERIKAAEHEIAEAKRIIEAEDKIDLREGWIGKWGFYSDADPTCPNDRKLAMLKEVDDDDRPFLCDGMLCDGMHWRYFRPATPEELGFQKYEAMRDFIERQTMIDPIHPEARWWSWKSLVEEARRILLLK